MDCTAKNTEKLNGCLDAFAKELHCYLCNNLFKSPYTATHCGHIYCHDCIKNHLKAGNTECPQCGVQIQGKSLTRNSSYSTMVQCITKIRNLLNGVPSTQPAPTDLKEQEEVLKAVLDGIIDDKDEITIENNDSKENVINKPVKKDELKIEKVQKKDILKVKKSEIKPKKVIEPKPPKQDIKAIKEIKEISLKPEKTVKPEKSLKKVFGLLLTGLSEDQKSTIQSNLQNLSKISGNNPFKVIKEYSPETVSHIICACAPKAHCPRTLKYLLGIAGKAWIVSFDWILESLEAGAILDEKEFVVVGDEAVQCDTMACQKSRADPGKLFEGKKFYLAGLFNAPGPSKVELTNLIQIAGGAVCKKPEDGTFIVSNNSNGPKKGEMPYTWLFDAISLYKI